MIVLDANVLIGFLDGSDPHHAATLDLLERRFADGFGSSILTVAEALVHPTRAGRQDAAKAALERIGVQVLSLDASETEALARVRTDYRLRMPDAVVLHAAIRSGSEIASFDSELRSAAVAAGVILAT